MVWINSRGLRAPYVSVLHDSHPAACHGRWKVPGKHGETRSVANWKIPNARIWGFTSFNVRQIDLFIHIYIYIEIYSIPQKAMNAPTAGRWQVNRSNHGWFHDDSNCFVPCFFPILLVNRQAKSSRAQDDTPVKAKGNRCGGIYTDRNPGD